MKITYRFKLLRYALGVLRYAVFYIPYRQNDGDI
jgi:hypothetical protein